MPAYDMHEVIERKGSMYPQTKAMQHRLMTVSGSGKVAAQPNVVNIQLGVVTEGQSLTQVQEENARVMERVIGSIVNLGVQRGSIQTADYSILPQYNYDSGSQVFQGYQVNHMISVTSEDIRLAGEIIDTAVQNGANQVIGVQFSIKQSEMLYQQSLSIALRDAYMKARSMAQTMGLTLDPAPVKVLERMPGGAFPLARGEAFATVTPIEPGQLEIEAFVEVQFQFYA
ncbi:SIMPL domain-containing protein [Halobacillus campisalis]|uniref:SIMPL domain-containing protein n=1 Tax=Halobacillus campisalis TaxID=435909 RepID=A0ABW2K5Z8_9BACI|nr:SIMPL domain-containing protein [Halobacillus campisalis]